MQVWLASSSGLLMSTTGTQCVRAQQKGSVMNEQQQEIAKQLGYIRKGISNNLHSMEINYRKASKEFDNIDAYMIALRESLTALVRAESEIISNYAS